MARKKSVRRHADRTDWRGLQVGMGITLVVLGVVAFNQRRASAAARRRRPMRDYSERSGFPMGVEASRGIASDAPIPADMRIPDPLRPFTNGSLR